MGEKTVFFATSKNFEAEYREKNANHTQKKIFLSNVKRMWCDKAIRKVEMNLESNSSVSFIVNVR